MADEVEKRIQSYAEFWVFYLSQHSHRTGRLIHIIGTLLALAVIVKAIICFKPLLLLLVPLIGYGAAWIAHAFVEKNHPATFTYPLWSLRGDFHMLWLWLTGRLEAELIKYKITT